MSKIQEVNLNQLKDKEMLTSAQSSESAPKKNNNEIEDINLDMNKIPDYYGDNKLVLQVKNPTTAHLYWEYTSARITDVCSKAGYSQGDDIPLILRVYNLSLGRDYNVYYDIDISESHNSWYLNDLKSAKSYEVKLGVLDQFGNLHSVLKSNRINMPANQVSDILDEEWMTVKETMDIVYLLSGVLPAGIDVEDTMSSDDLIKKEVRQISRGFNIDISTLEKRLSSLELIKGSSERLVGSSDVFK
ncbi:DUF4912 domain-containing protein [Orenia marismortui]|uniref:DUF4912 domain-containing protein n=1 Tax=Orenia marismortui TaxID=46469 RepID=A0A4R8GG19_9FIRM|nr:DUF4912 domain-containing protein [Orenia marismortui]TDX44576.1 hypothetical protein C7959_1516 [Orenia marismortui]